MKLSLSLKGLFVEVLRGRTNLFSVFEFSPLLLKLLVERMSGRISLFKDREGFLFLLGFFFLSFSSESLKGEILSVIALGGLLSLSL